VKELKRGVWTRLVSNETFVGGGGWGKDKEKKEESLKGP